MLCIISMMFIFTFFFQVALDVVWPFYSCEDGYLWIFPVRAMREISSLSSSSDCERRWYDADCSSIPPRARILFRIHTMMVQSPIRAEKEIKEMIVIANQCPEL